MICGLRSDLCWTSADHLLVKVLLPPHCQYTKHVHIINIIVCLIASVLRKARCSKWIPAVSKTKGRVHKILCRCVHTGESCGSTPCDSSARGVTSPSGSLSLANASKQTADAVTLRDCPPGSSRAAARSNLSDSRRCERTAVPWSVLQFPLSSSSNVLISCGAQIMNGKVMEVLRLIGLVAARGPPCRLALWLPGRLAQGIVTADTEKRNAMYVQFSY
jgi:hypothetical protein